MADGLHKHDSISLNATAWYAITRRFPTTSTSKVSVARESVAELV
jgi:hypothetical protein